MKSRISFGNIWADMTKKILQNDRVCSCHFISGKLAALHNTTNPDWLPMLHLGHLKVESANGDRWDWMHSRRLTTQVVSATLPLKLEYPEPSHGKPSVEVQTDISAANVSLLREELIGAYQQIANLKAKLSAKVPFSDQFFLQALLMI